MKRLSFLLIFSVIATLSMAQAKYVFFLIGDGMGTNQVLAAEMYLAELKGKIDREPLLMTTFPYSGHIANYSNSNSIADSGASGTTLASGKKTSPTDTVWSVAKRYHAPLAALTAANNLPPSPNAGKRESLEGVEYLIV